MVLSTRRLALAATAALLALAGAQTVMSAPSPEVQTTVRDDAFRPGADGVDLAAVTGPKGSGPKGTGSGKLPACADPARRGDLRPC